MSFLQTGFQVLEIIDIFTYKLSAFTQKGISSKKKKKQTRGKKSQHPVVLCYRPSATLCVWTCSDNIGHVEENSDWNYRSRFFWAFCARISFLLAPIVTFPCLSSEWCSQPFFWLLLQDVGGKEVKEMSKEISHMAYLVMVVLLAGLLAIFRISLELAWFSFIISQHAMYEHQFFIEFLCGFSYPHQF